MPVKARHTRLLMGSDGAGYAYDFSGVSNSLETSLAIDSLEDTGFQSDRTFVAGDSKGDIKQAGYFHDSGAGSFEETLAEAMDGGDLLYVAALYGTNAVAPNAAVAYVAPQTNGSSIKLSAKVGNLITLDGGWGSGTGIVRGKLAGSGTIAATGALDYIDLGAMGSDGGTAYLFVTTITGTATNATITVQSDDNTSFTSPATEGTFTFSDEGVYVVTMTGDVDRYIRLNCTSKGGATSFAVFGIVAVNGVTM